MQNHTTIAQTVAAIVAMILWCESVTATAYIAIAKEWTFIIELKI